MVRPPRGSIKESQKGCYSTTEESQCIFLYSWMYVSCRSISVYCPVSYGSYMCPNNFPASVSQTSQTGASETTVSLHTSTFQLPPANASVSLVGASLCIMPVCLLKQELWETLTQLFPQPLQANASASQAAQIGTTHIQPSQAFDSVSQTKQLTLLPRQVRIYKTTVVPVGKIITTHQNQDFWIAYDLCDHWYYSSCERLSSEPTTLLYVHKMYEVTTIEKCYF